MNTDKKSIISEMFNKDEKAPLEEIRKTVADYDKAYYEILNLSNDVVDYPLFRVMAGSLKENLGK